jgi:type IVB pilus formation R64 PilN family outer membrane protein
LKGTLSVWKDLEATIKELLSPDGKVMVSEATTTVTVRDRPTNVALVGQYIKNLNHSLSRQVLVKIQVLDVALTSDFTFGINWSAVKKTLNGNLFQLNADYGTPVSITPLTSTAATSTGLPQIGIDGSNSSGGSSVTALINALKQQGNVSIVTEPRVVCLNNQVSAVRIVNQRGYLASIQNTTVAGSSQGGASSNTVTSQITPGTVVTGFTLYVLPKILGKKVYLQVNADLSNLQSIDTISSTGNGTATAGGSSPLIQTPRVTQKQFNQRSVIGSGDTLILSGFKQMTNQTGAMQLLDSQDLGGKASHQERVETIVLITPIILHGYA